MRPMPSVGDVWLALECPLGSADRLPDNVRDRGGGHGPADQYRGVRHDGEVRERAPGQPYSCANPQTRHRVPPTPPTLLDPAVFYGCRFSVFSQFWGGGVVTPVIVKRHNQLNSRYLNF